MVNHTGTPKILVLDRNAALARQVDEVVGGLRPEPEVRTVSRLGVVAEVLAADGPFDVLVAGPSLATRSGLARLRAVHDQLPQMQLLLAFGHRPDATLRDIVRTGAVDLVQVPVDDEVLAESIRRALALATSKPAPEQHEHGFDADVARRASVGRVLTMSSATGGCGKTFIATNLAYLLSHYSGKRACIIDLDLQFGEVSTALRLRPRYTIHDALQRDDADDADLQAHIDEYMVSHQSGISVLAAPKDPAEADTIDPVDVTRIINAARARFDYVVVDTPSALNEIVLAAFDLSDTLFTMATLDLPSVRNMGVFLSALERLKIPSDNIKLLLNKAETDVGIDVAQVTRLFPRGFTAVLPYAKEVSRSINLGTPVLAASPNAPISKLMFESFGSLLPEAERAIPVPAGGVAAAGDGWCQRLFRRQPAQSPRWRSA